MLWTDRSTLLTTADLLSVDPHISEVASVESVNLSTTIAEAQSEAGQKLLSALQQFSSFRSNGDVTSAHLAAVFSQSRATSSSRVRLGQVVAVDFQRHAIWHWLRSSTLASFYRSINSRFISGDGKVNDRYRLKYDFYSKESREKWIILMRFGIPIVTQPIPAPGAVGERDAGTFDATNLTQSVSVGAAGGIYYAAVTYVHIPTYISRDPQNRNNGESATSQAFSRTVSAGNSLSVSIAGLSVSQDNQDRDYVFNPPLVPTHWNIYVGTSESNMRLQNSAPIAIGTTSYTLPSDPTTTGFRSDTGQIPNYSIVLQNLLGVA